MKLEEFSWLTKSYGSGKQIVLEFGSDYNLSIIDDGYGKDKGLYEIAVFKNGEFANMPGITEHDDINGFLTSDNVDAIIVKMYTITGKQPRQI